MPNYKPKTNMPVVVKEYLRDLLVQNKIEEVNILFSGSGDDGQVDDVYYEPNSVSSVKEDA